MAQIRYCDPHVFDASIVHHVSYDIRSTPMRLEDYFDFLSPVKGSRIGIESVLYEYLHRGCRGRG